MFSTRILLSFIVVIVSLVSSQEKTGGAFHGLIVGDYFYKTGGDTLPYGGASQFSQPLQKDSSGFQIRRLHLFYDYVFSEDFSTRFQLEGNEKSLDPGGRLSLYVKTAYAEWKNLVPMASLFVGLVQTPTWQNVEGRWGYRSVEKTITDFRGLGSLVDMGVHLRGMLFTKGSIGYSLMVGNGNAMRPENNPSRKYYAMLNGSPIQNFNIETYVDYEPGTQNKDRATWKVFLSYQEPSIMIGTEIMEQIQGNQDSLHAEYAPSGISLFSWYQCSDTWKIYGRVDYFDPDRSSSSGGFYEFFISLGLDYIPVKGVHFMPNIWINTFTDKSSLGRTKAADVVPRMTFFFAFN